jgi:hypothetical protein
MNRNMISIGRIVALVTSLGLCLPAEAAVTNITLSDSQRVIDHFPQDGNGNEVSISSSFVGDYDNALGNSSNRMFRMSYVFALPQLGLGYSVNDATFSMVIDSINQNGNLPDLDVALLNKGAVGTGVKGDYEAAPVATLSSIATPATA